MKLLGSTKRKITNDKNGENMPYLEITEVLLIHCNVVNNSYLQNLRVLYTFVPKKSLGQLLDISPENFMFLKTFDSKIKTLWQNYRDEPALTDGEIIDFPANGNNCASFKFKQQITGQTGNGGTKDIGIMVPLKYLSNFWRALEMPSTDCEISLQLKWSKISILLAGTEVNQNPSFQ